MNQAPTPTYLLCQACQQVFEGASFYQHPCCIKEAARRQESAAPPPPQIPQKQQTENAAPSYLQCLECQQIFDNDAFYQHSCVIPKDKRAGATTNVQNIQVQQGTVWKLYVIFFRQKATKRALLLYFTIEKWLEMEFERTIIKFVKLLNSWNS